MAAFSFQGLKAPLPLRRSVPTFSPSTAIAAAIFLQPYRVCRRLRDRCFADILNPLVCWGSKISWARCTPNKNGHRMSGPWQVDLSTHFNTLFVLLFLFPSIVSIPQSSRRRENNRNDTLVLFECILGAGQEVGKSCVVVSFGDKRIMFDCGMHMGYVDNRRYPDFSRISESGDFNSSLTCIVITHL